jgi:hypothetical protein
MDVYLGRSKGFVDNLYESGGTTQLKFKKNYIQFEIHWIRKSIGFDLATRIGRLNYYEAKYLRNHHTLVPTSLIIWNLEIILIC